MSESEDRQGLPGRFYDTRSMENDSAGYTHFFDAGAKRFFRSRIGSNAYPAVNPFVTLFVTSEQFVTSDGHAEPRLYTIRSYDWRTRSVDTVGEFQQYTSSRAANRAAQRLALTMLATVDDWHMYALALNETYDQRKRRAMARGDQGFVMYDIGAVNDWIAIGAGGKQNAI